jgi:hypothetical protein
MTVQPSDASFAAARPDTCWMRNWPRSSISPWPWKCPFCSKGEPGTGKTMLAHAIAESLNMPLIVLNVKSSMKLVEALIPV